MKNRIKYLRIKYLYVFRKYRISMFLSPLLSILAFLMVQSCYSTSAIKGIPVKELVVARDQTVTRRMPTEEEKEEIARMSRVTSNKVFTVISGIPEYRIGPLDLLEITSHVGDKKTTTTATVNNRGRISHSFIDDLDVAGLTPSQVDDLLTKKMSTYIKKPRIDILVKEFKSKNALVMGELVSLRSTYTTKGESGRIYLQGKTTLMDFIALAGGYTERGDIRNTRIIRGGKTYTINLFDIIQRGDKNQNIIIDDGDIVEISELPDIDERIYVLGEVANQGIYALKNARDLLGAIALAGSITKLAVEENTLIVRGYESGKKPLVMMADLKAILRKGDLSQNIPLNNGDLVYVPRMKIGDINDWIENTIPLLDILLYPGRFRDSYIKEE
jgi:polysaccharide export outer membrane protein